MFWKAEVGMQTQTRPSVPCTSTPYTLTSWMKSTSPRVSVTSVVATFSPFHLKLGKRDDSNQTTLFWAVINELNRVSAVNKDNPACIPSLTAAGTPHWQTTRRPQYPPDHTTARKRFSI